MGSIIPLDSTRSMIEDGDVVAYSYGTGAPVV